MSRKGSRRQRGVPGLPTHLRCEIGECRDQRAFRVLVAKSGDAFGLDVCGSHANYYRGSGGQNIIDYKDGPSYSVISVRPLNRKG